MTKVAPAQTVAESIEKRLFAVEAERDCKELLALYGFYADLGPFESWVNLFTDDAVMDFSFFDDTAYYDDAMNPRDVDPSTIALPLVRSVFTGRDELFECIAAPRHKRIMGHCQHQVGGQPALFRLTDEQTAFIISDSIIYARAVDNFTPTVQYQHHCLNRWDFRRAGDGWRITKNVRRTMSDDSAVELLAGI